MLRDEALALSRPCFELRATLSKSTDANFSSCSSTNPCLTCKIIFQLLAYMYVGSCCYTRRQSDRIDRIIDRNVGYQGSLPPPKANCETPCKRLTGAREPLKQPERPHLEVSQPVMATGLHQLSSSLNTLARQGLPIQGSHVVAAVIPGR